MTTCSECRFWWTNPANGVPTCRRFPAWIVREAGDWCGEFETIAQPAFEAPKQTAFDSPAHLDRQKKAKR